ncbi:hypothetical protein [Micromonospora sp. NPDC050495]
MCGARLHGCRSRGDECAAPADQQEHRRICADACRAGACPRQGRLATST